MEKSICIFCASSTQVPQIYHNEAEALARELVNRQYKIVYGAGSVGLMGTVAQTAGLMKGYVKGVIPQFMVDMEWANQKIDELVVVEDMHERKKLMIAHVDAVIALAGGIGTLDELLEVITLKQLGQFTKPIIIVNTNHFFDPLIAQIDKMIEEGFMRVSNRLLFIVTQSIEEVMSVLDSARESDPSIINEAQY